LSRNALQTVRLIRNDLHVCGIAAGVSRCLAKSFNPDVAVINSVNLAALWKCTELNKTITRCGMLNRII
jgi:hypothetical protein